MGGGGGGGAIEVSRFGFIKVECEISVKKMKKMVVTCKEL